MRDAKLNWNTLFLTVGFAVMGWEGKRLADKVDSAHDDVIAIKSTMVSHAEFDVEMTQLKIRVAAVELYIQTMKDKRP